MPQPAPRTATGGATALCCRPLGAQTCCLVRVVSVCVQLDYSRDINEYFAQREVEWQQEEEEEDGDEGGMGGQGYQEEGEEEDGYEQEGDEGHGDEEEEEAYSPSM